MNEPFSIALAQNISLLLALVFVFDVTALRWRNNHLRFWQIPVGFLIGAMGIAVMLSPWEYTPGIVFDTRSILLGVSGLFFGAVPTVIAMLITAVYRFFVMGGSGAIMGVSVIIATGSSGILWRYLRKKPLEDARWGELYLFGIFIHALMLILTVTLPSESILRVLAIIALPVIVVYPIGTAFLGKWMGNRLRHEVAADEIRKNETRFKIVADYTQDWEYWLGPDDSFIYSSPSCQNLTGYSQDQFIKNPKILSEIVYAEDAARFNEHRCLAGTMKTNQLEFRIRHADGSIRWIEHMCLPVYDAGGQYLGIRGSNRDITGRKLAEELLKKSEEQFRILAEISTDMVSLHSSEGVYLYVSPACREITGYEPGELIGHSAFEFIHPDDHARLEKTRVTVVNGRSGSVVTYRICRKDGSIVWVESNSNLVGEMKEGHCVDIQVSTRDISERKETEEKMEAVQMELESMLEDAERSRRVLLSVIEDQKMAESKIRQLNNELEQRVHERTIQLEVANKELEAFSYSVSHDLRAPLRSLEGFSTALLEDYTDRLDEEGRLYLERIQDAARRMGELINSLLDLSRITRAYFNRQEVDLTLVAQEIVTELRTNNPQRQVAVEIDPKMIIQCDRALIKIALGNILGNAFKFTTKKPQAQIWMGEIQEEGERVFFVRDNGAGFDMAYVDKLFKPFQRLHSGQEYPGTGIGLSIVERIITRHGGRIWVESAIDQGTTFFFTLI